MKIIKPIVKIAAGFTLVTMTTLMSLGLVSCDKVSGAADYSHTLIIDQSADASTQHKARPTESGADRAYETECGYKTSVRGVANDSKGIYGHLVTWRAYQHEKDIHPSILEKTELCPECYQTGE